MSTMGIRPQKKQSVKKFLQLGNKMLVDPSRIAFLKQLRQPLSGARSSEVKGWQVGGLNDLADAQFLIISDEVARSLRDDLGMTELFDDQHKATILINLQQIAGIERNGSVVRFYVLENGKRTCVLASVLASADPLGI